MTVSGKNPAYEDERFFLVDDVDYELEAVSVQALLSTKKQE